MKPLIRRLLFAYSFLTLLPGLGKLRAEPEETGKSTAFYPVVGLTIGFFLFILCLLKGLSPFTLAVLLTVFVLFISRGMHADGLIDTLDGFLSGAKTRKEILKIMRDSRLGALGFIGAFSLYSLKIAFIYEILLGRGDSAPYFALLFPALSRGQVPLVCALFPYGGGEKGLGRAFVESAGAKEALLSFIALELFMLIPGSPEWLFMPPALSIFWAGWGFLCMRKIGGITGDTIGAGVELSEVFALVLIRIIK